MLIFRVVLLGCLGIVVVQSFHGDYSNWSTSFHLNGTSTFFTDYSWWVSSQFLVQGKDPFVPYVNIELGQFRVLYATKSSDYQWLVRVPASLPLMVTFIAAGVLLFRS